VELLGQRAWKTGYALVGEATARARRGRRRAAAAGGRQSTDRDQSDKVDRAATLDPPPGVGIVASHSPRR
jgi:hypothetical protein